MLYIWHDLARIYVVDWLIYCSKKHASSVLIFVQNILRRIWDHHRLKLHLFLIVNNLIVTMTFAELVDGRLVVGGIIDWILELALMCWHVMHLLKIGVLSGTYGRYSNCIRLSFLKHRLSLDLAFVVICWIHSIQTSLLVFHPS